MRRAPKNAPWDDRVFIIAEAGVNHDGDMDKAFALIEAAAAAGADAVKFQTWLPGEIVGRFSHKVDYLERTTGVQETFYDLLERLRIGLEDTGRLKAACETAGVMFMSTPEGFDTLAHLTDGLDMAVVKIGSSEVNHSTFLTAAGKTGRPVILSTGASTLDEARHALTAVRAGGDPPVCVLHCVSEYPAPDGEMNLRALTTLADELGVVVGLSDHSLGAEAAVAATAMGARVIEKHLTLDTTAPGPDHAASMAPEDFAALVRAVRRIEAMLGDGVKRPRPSEAANISGIRRSVVALDALPAGTVLAAAHLGCKRPGTGAPPDDLPRLIGHRLTRALQPDEPVAWADVEPAGT